MDSKQVLSDLLIYVILTLNFGFLCLVLYKLNNLTLEFCCMLQDVLAIKALIYDLRYNVIYTKVEELRVREGEYHPTTNIYCNGLG